MERIYHPYWKWEDYEAGFYENISGKEKDSMVESVLEMFNSEEKTREMMMCVINNWKNSCEHNLTNQSMNKIAYLGQSACCFYAKVPSSITMSAWSLLSKEVKERSNRIAKDVLLVWEKQNKYIQLCLNID